MAKIFSGAPCKICGGQERYFSNRGCVICARQNSKFIISLKVLHVDDRQALINYAEALRKFRLGQ